MAMHWVNKAHSVPCLSPGQLWPNQLTQEALSHWLENAWCLTATSPHARCIQSRNTPPHSPQHSMSSWSILILSAYLHLGFPCSLFPSDVLTNSVCNYLPCMPHASTHPIHLHLFIIIFCKVYKSQITSYDAIVYILLLLPLSYAQIFHQRLFFNTSHYLHCK